MDTIVNEKKNDGKTGEAGVIDSNRETIKKALYTAIGTAIDDETERATQEMLQERENAIKQIVEDGRAVIKKIVEDETKALWAKALESGQSETFNPELIKEKITQALVLEESIISGKNEGTPVSDNNHNNADNGKHNDAVVEKHDDAIANKNSNAVVKEPNVAVNVEKVELEILPPRDLYQISSLHTYLTGMPEAVTVELITLVDKSIFRIKLNRPVDFIERLGALPQVLNAEEVIENGQRKIKITLLAKSQLEKNQNEMNEKVKKIFRKKK